MVKLHALELDPEMPMALPNQKFDVPADRKYLHITLLPNRTRKVTIPDGEPSLHMGIFQILVNWPVDVGEIEPREIAGLVANHFEGAKMPYGGSIVHSPKRPTVGSSLPEGADLKTPVSVEYETFI